MNKNKSNTKLLLFLLVFYVLLQLVWWGYLLSELNKEVYKNKIENIAYTSINAGDRENQNFLLHQKLNHRLWMILGEGSVFLIILSIGVYRLVKVMNAEYELNKRQHNFLLSVTHELKSPLASARLQLETILKRNLDKDKHDKIISNALQDLDRLNTLTDNILTATQIENSNYVLDLSSINVSELTANILQTIVFKNPRRQIISKIEKDIIYKIDKDAFTSIIINLIENALKYSLDEFAVMVELKVIDNKLVLLVKDNGVGIEENEKKEIFKKFYRIGNEDTRKTKGTGLGLFITKQIVDSHKGSIVIENNNPAGSIFKITL